MFWIVLLACTDVHTHDELTQRVEALERKVEQQSQDIQKWKSLELQKKNVRPLCEKEQPGAYVIIREKLEEFIQNEESRPRVLPHQKDGEILGLRLANVNESWRTCDLEDGDLLLSIDGVSVKTPRTLQGIYERLYALENVSIVRVRSGEQQTLRIRILNHK